MNDECRSTCIGVKVLLFLCFVLFVPMFSLNIGG